MLTMSFDEKAKTWDSRPDNIERSQQAALAISELISLDKGMDALDFGAGTGLISFFLSEKLNHITMMDASVGMVEVMKEKVDKSESKNLEPLFFDLTKNDYPDRKFDLIYSLLVLHHIEDIQGLFNKFYQMSKPGCRIAIMDLYEEDGTFHGEGFTGHKGFNPDNLTGIIKNSGFKDIKFSDFIEVKGFKTFIVTASKTGNTP